jgi:hypothetical protein
MAESRLHLYCSVRTKYYLGDTDGTLRVYVPRDMSNPRLKDPCVRFLTCAPESEIKRIQKLDSRGKPITAPGTRTVKIVPSIVPIGDIPSDMPIFFDVMCKRYTLGDSDVTDKEKKKETAIAKGVVGERVVRWKDRTFPQSYSSHMGLGCCLVGDLFKASGDVVMPIMDVAGGEVGHLFVGLHRDQPVIELTSPRGDGFVYGRSLHDKTAAFVKALGPSLTHSSNITYTGRISLDTVKMVHGTIPMAIFPLCLLSAVDTDTHKTERMFIGLLEIAIYSMRLKDDIDAYPLPTLMELICEMVLTPSRHSLYVIDNMKRTGTRSVRVDDWEFSSHSGTGDLEGGDCEDRAITIMELLLCMKKATFMDSRLVKLQTHLRRCIPLFSIGVILLRPGVYTYHAFVMLLDAKLVRGWGEGDVELKDPMPSCLLEGTNSSTSCWSYDDGFESASVYQQKHLMDPIEANTPVSRSVIKSRRIYQHVVCAFSPELYMDTGVVKLELSQNGREAALISDVMDIKRSSSYRVHPLRVDVDLPSFTQCLPRLFSLADPPDSRPAGIISIVDDVSPGVDPSRIKREKPAYDLSYRGVDWNMLVRQRIQDQTHGVITQIVTMQLVDGGTGVRIRVWI